MSDRLSERSCAAFATALAAKQPVPGGGGAAALAGALAAALCSMVGNFTTGKKAYEAVEQDIVRTLKEAELVRHRLIELIDEDAQAFEPLAAAYAIPRDDPSRQQVMEKATKNACAAPLEMMRQICRSIELLEEMGDKGSRLLISDVGVGALLARAALEAASLNVFINTKSLADREFAKETEDDCDDMLALYVPRAEACAALVMDRIRG